MKKNSNNNNSNKNNVNNSSKNYNKSNHNNACSFHHLLRTETFYEISGSSKEYRMYKKFKIRTHPHVPLLPILFILLFLALLSLFLTSSSSHLRSSIQLHKEPNTV